MTISPLEIGFALSAGLLVVGYVSSLPKPQPVRIRSRPDPVRRSPRD